ncbi:phytoene/squalene synthase family protein [Xanthobacter sp.]|uniref:phytoene/squalene synthase family protein n=1 Tax=Xanthobacter sp. TaxID=35809 RepID=UPI0025EC563A|nr:phytoene/squalene synthase family protein [Xanthobacter sp.]
MSGADAAPDVVGASEEAIAKGSKSFAAAARLFGPRMREDAVMLYAWCRHCDDVVDGQELGHGRIASAQTPAERLDALFEETRRAYRGVSSSHPAFAAFAEVVRRNDIPERHPFDLLEGFRMDVEDRRYQTLDDTLTYCYHVAGVVGVMMALIMGARDEVVLDRASDLGLGFQLTNISRDVIEDAGIGRIYVPETFLLMEGVPDGGIAAPEHRPQVAAAVARLLDVAEPYYEQAVIGMGALPFRAAAAVGAARCVYRGIGTEVRRRGPKAWDARVSTSKAQKIGYLMQGIGLALAIRRSRPQPPRPTHLWTRPR